MVPTGFASQRESHVSQAQNVTSEKQQTKWEAVHPNSEQLTYSTADRGSGNSPSR